MSRVLNLAVVAAATLIIANSKADAAVVDITEGSTSGCTLTNGNTYVIQNSVEFSNSEAGGSGISVADNATVVLYVPAGVTLTAVGAHGSGRMGGGAGIRVPETSTLIITGEGMVNATGGNAGDGADGEDGLVGSAQNSGSGMSVSGVGGSGGAGGGGSGAAIGGSGGAGGEGGEGGRAAVSGDNISGNNGNDGNPGAESERMGSVYVLGKISIETRSGMSGMGGVAGSFAPRKYSSVSPGWKW